jgi:hypothetical protein
MTASPAVAQPVPDTGALPETEEAPPEKRRRKLLLLLLLLGAFLALLGLAIWYLLFRQPIPIPTVPGETIMPGYVTSFYGATRRWRRRPQAGTASIGSPATGRRGCSTRRATSWASVCRRRPAISTRRHVAVGQRRGVRH